MLLVVFLLYLTFSKYIICYPTLPKEPSLPTSVCTTLTAQLTSSNGKLSQELDSKADTSRIQSALNACGSGRAVKLTANSNNDSFLTAPISIPSGVTLWVDKGVILFASRIAKDYEKSPGSCGIVTDANTGCYPMISANNTINSGIVGTGIIDGRGGEILSGNTKSWWDIASDAKAQGKVQNNPHMIEVNGGSNFLMYKITIHNGMFWQVVPSRVNRFTAWAVRIQAPTKAYSNYTSATAHNTDGIDPVGCSNVVIANSYINTGDDNIAIKGFGMDSTNIIIANNHFYNV
jgi:polygalacturonase